MDTDGGVEQMLGAIPTPSQVSESSIGEDTA